MISLCNNKTGKLKDNTYLLIKTNLDKGNKYLLWKLKFGDELGDKKKKYKYLTLIKEIKTNGNLHSIDYLLDEKIPDPNTHPVEEMYTTLNALNIKNFDIYIASEEEVKPYLKEVLVMALMHEPYRVDN